ncbi:hypothetical protein J2R98_001421 [Alkalibacillus filiformis]|uniref:Phage protein n=1 Tax=Alkalibacillus filiformis TaxID=200990 RepID=A0ABU0DT21_9BACI|nr:hypothetical protein [Alkalibacillus filiformis]MDQ0351604.1 hypothetical protein [Alkalibacillus filiformis]
MERRPKRKRTSKNYAKQYPNIADYSVADLYRGKHLDLITAALLLTGKLKVDSVELFRNNPSVEVTLLGRYMVPKKEHINALEEFLEENGDLTLDEIFEALNKRLEKEGL